MHDHRATLELAASAIDWPLSVADRDRLERELAGCLACRRTARSLDRTAGILVERAVVLPSPRVDRAVEAAIAARRPSRPWPVLLVAAALCLTILGGLFVAGGRIELPVIAVTRPTTTVEQAPRPSGLLAAGELAIGGTAVVVSPDGAALASQPGAAPDGPTLVSGQRMAVADGPLPIAGTDWYRLIAGSLAGWAAVRDGSGRPVLASLLAGDLGSVIATSDGHVRLRLASASGVERWTVDEPTLGDARNPTWSGDGSTLAFSARPIGDGAARAVYLLGADGGGLRRAGTGSVEELWPDWNPADGRLVATRQDPSGPIVATIDPRNGGAWTTVGDGNAPSWSADGRRIAVLRGPTDGRYRLSIIDADGSERDLTDAVFPLSRVSWSPDGATIASIGSTESGCAVCIVDVASGRIDRVSDTVRGYPSWSADGGRLGIATSGSSQHVVGLLSLDGSLTTLTTGALPAPGAEWSPDDRWLVAAAIVGGSRRTLLVPSDGSASTALEGTESQLTATWRPVVVTRPG